MNTEVSLSTANDHFRSSNANTVISFPADSFPSLNNLSLSSDSDGDEFKSSANSLAATLLFADSDQLLVLLTPL